MIPTIVQGIIYGQYSEVAVYSSNMVASAIYHLCDYQLECYGVGSFILRFCDFLLSYMSILVTIFYLGRFSYQLKAYLHSASFVVMVYLGLLDSFDGFFTSMFVICI